MVHHRTLCIIFQYEYLGQNVEYSNNQFYTIDHPLLKMLLALGTLEPMWLIPCESESAPFSLTTFTPPWGGLLPRANWPLRTHLG